MIFCQLVILIVTTKKTTKFDEPVNRILRKMNSIDILEHDELE